ncbi:MAG: malonyl-[acyl-carrier protein] O-methyltransferase BioC, partial [Psychrilyobacter sp.]|nr:malonyl-[acyl-carrier protein] O-methyltransferase BioC [Psychrilyobacter sp.]
MNFNNKFDKYDENAHVQKKVAIKLMSLLPKESYNSIFEIGCGTGILSKEINKKINYNNFFIND